MTENNEQGTPVAQETKATRTPRGHESITKGALSLPLAERASLRDALVKSVADEVQALATQADNAKKLLG